ncbi:MAG: MFS transporter [Ktedonobacteraceae bacterium]|nr:MFS transporter [Ktedonobacteraceae bacterium]
MVIDSIARSTQRKRYMYIIPYVFILYIIAFLDRTNVSYAALGMNKALGMTSEAFGLGAGIFFFGYFILEIPSTLLVEKWSARKWISRILLTWGVVAVLTAFVQNEWQFYIARFLIGLAEAGFFPGIVLYLTHWFRQQEQARAVALFMTALPVSNIIGAPVSGALLQYVHWFGLAGWQWVFIIEGLPAVIFGILNVFLMVDRPEHAKWLTPEEKQWLRGELDREASLVREKERISLWQALGRWDTWVLALIYFFVVTGFYGFGLWLPQIVKRLFGESNDFYVSLITMIPYIFAFVGMILVANHSDRTGERRMHVFIPVLVGGVGLLLSALITQPPWLTLVLFVVAAIGIYGFFGPFWTFPSVFLTDEARAGGLGLINSVGNLGGFLGPYAVGFLAGMIPKAGFLYGLLFLVLCLLIGAVFVLLVRKTTVQAAEARATASPAD